MAGMTAGKTNSTFNLTGVWRLRKARRDASRLALAEIVLAQQQLAGELLRVARQLETCQERRQRASAPGVLRLDDLQREMQVEESLRGERQQYLAQATNLESELHRRQDELREAESEWQAVEWLRESWEIEQNALRAFDADR